jgi:conjugal transfer pilus assembly protein TraE
MPPEISKPFWISGTDASPEYFEELAQFVGSLTTNITPETAAMSCNQFLLYILPKDRDKFRAKCDLEISRVKRDNVSQMFSLREVRADAKNKRVALFGTTLSFVGGKQLTKEAEVFLIEFAHYNGRFYVINHEKTDPEDPFHAKK